MANYYLSSDGSLTKKKKKQSGNNYKLGNDGKLQLIQDEEDIAPVKKETKKTSEFKPITETMKEKGMEAPLANPLKQAKDGITGLAGIAGNFLMGIEGTIPKASNFLTESKEYLTKKATGFILGKAADAIAPTKTEEGDKLKDALVGIANDAMYSKVSELDPMTQRNERMNSEEKQEWRNETIAKNTQKAAKLGKVGSFANDVSLGVGQNVIPMALAFVPGGQPISAGLFMTSAGGSYLEEAEQRGMNDDEKMGYATTMGIFEGGFDWLTMGFATKALKLAGAGEFLTKESLKNTLFGTAMNAVQEGLTEPANEYAASAFSSDNTVAERLTGKGEYANWDNIGSRMLHSAAVGAVSGLIFDGAGKGVGSAVYTVNVNQNTQQAVKTAEEQLGRKLTTEEKTQIQDQVKQHVKAQMTDTTNLTPEEKAEIEKLSNMSIEDMTLATIENVINSGKVDVESVAKGVNNALEEQNQAAPTNGTLTQEQYINELDALQREYLQAPDVHAQTVIQQQIDELQAQAEQQGINTNAQQITDTQVDESELRKQNFAYQAQETDSDIKKAVYESASQVMNNTEKAHKFVDVIAKVAEERGTTYKFTNNEQLKELGYAKENVAVNGLVNENGEVLINIDSAKTLETVVGHETTHLLEGTQEYEALKQVAIEYAKSKGDYDTKMAQLQSLYKDTNANIENELVSDIVGDYLFTDEAFVRELSVKQPTLFEKIKNFISDLVVKFKGTDQEKQLRQLQRSFEKAYKAQGTKTVDKTQYSLESSTNENMQQKIDRYSRLVKEMQQEGKSADDWVPYANEILRLQDQLNNTDTKYSLSTTDNQGRTLTKEQQEYFKDSKVRDDDGNLLVMYHGSESKFNEFNSSVNWFTDSKEYSNYYGRKENTIQKALGIEAKKSKNTYKTYLDIKNPKVLGNIDGYIHQDFDVKRFIETSNISREDFNKLLEEYNTGKSEYEKAYRIYDLTNSEVFKNYLIEQGYDGIKANEKGHTSYGAFNSNQIKNINNTNPTNNPDIRKSLSAENDIAPRDPNLTYTEDVKLQVEEAIAPLQETVEKLTEQVQEKIEGVTEQVQEKLEDITEQIQTIAKEVNNNDRISETAISPEANKTTRGEYQESEEVSNYKQEVEKYIKSNIKENFGLKNKDVDDIYNKIASKENLTIEDVYAAFDGHREIKVRPDANYIQEIKEIKGAIRNTRLQVSDEVRQLADWNDFRKANFGSLRLTKDGIPIDAFYQELASMYPGHFDPEIKTQADQLEALSDFMKANTNTLLNAAETYTLTDSDLNEVATYIYDGFQSVDSFQNYMQEMSPIAPELPVTAQNVQDEQLIPMVENTAQNQNTELTDTQNQEYEEHTGVETETQDGGKKLTKILTDMPEDIPESRVKEYLETAAIKLIDKGFTVKNEAIKYKNQTLEEDYNQIKHANRQAVNMIMDGYTEWDIDLSKKRRKGRLQSKKVTKSIDAALESVKKMNETGEFYNMMYNKLNVDRMSVESRAEAQIQQMLEANPILKELNKRNTISNIAKKLQDGVTQTITDEMLNEEIFKKNNDLFYSKEIRTAEAKKLYDQVREIIKLQKRKNKVLLNISAEESQANLKNYEGVAEFDTAEKDIRDIVNVYQDLLVDGGLISTEQKDYFNELYPHYIPAYRDVGGQVVNVNYFGNNIKPTDAVGKAKGGTQDILPLDHSLMVKGKQVVQSVAVNKYLQNLKETYKKNDILNVISTEVKSTEEAIEEGTSTERINKTEDGKYTATVFENGLKTVFEISKGQYEALKPSDIPVITTLNTFVDIKRSLLTQYNLYFAFRNFTRDFFTAALQSQDSSKWITNIPEAVVQVAKKGQYYQYLQSLGGGNSDYNDMNKIGYADIMPINTNADHKGNKFSRGWEAFKNWKGVKWIATINEFIEQVPRMAEFITAVDSGKSGAGAIYAQDEVTVNFGKGGDWTKTADRNVTNFVNANIQGGYKIANVFRDAYAYGGKKGLAKVITKYAIAGGSMVALMGALWDDDEEYEELSDYVKQNYYVLGKYGDGQFVKIPKGRTNAVIEQFINSGASVMKGEKSVGEATEDLMSVINNNLAPNSLVESSIFAGIYQTLTNTSWYGEDIVPTRLQKEEAKDQYDESTDAFSIWLGQKFGISPYKANYLLDQSTGFLGDMILPLLTEQAETPIDAPLGETFLGQFYKDYTTDSTMKNQNVTDIFELTDESSDLYVDAHKSDAQAEDILKYKYLSSATSEMNEYYKEKRIIQNEKGLSNSEKSEALRLIQRDIDNIAKNALETYENIVRTDNYATIGDKEYYKKMVEDDDGTLKEAWEKVEQDELNDLSSLNMDIDDKSTYFNLKAEISNIEKQDFDSNVTKRQIATVIKNVDLTDEQKAYVYGKSYSSDKMLDTVLNSNIPFNEYLSFASQEFVADKYSNGATVKNSRRDKVVSYVNSLNLSIPQKAILIRTEYPSVDTWNYQILDYVNGLNILYEDKLTILDKIDMKISKDGYVTW